MLCHTQTQTFVLYRSLLLVRAVSFVANGLLLLVANLHLCAFYISIYLYPYICVCGYIYPPNEHVSIALYSEQCFGPADIYRYVVPGMMFCVCFVVVVSGVSHGAQSQRISMCVDCVQWWS